MAGMNIVGGKWRVIIIHRLLNEGPMGFSALQSVVPGISSKVLSENLTELESVEIVERRVISDKPFRVEYSLTDGGRALTPVFEALVEWSTSYLTPPEEPRALLQND